ncbi:MAG: serine--tRNA ligase [Candidatus Aminicenantes bacterium]|nr:serine--tRNA ligase [Candidatus Aminicenantes bacterium]
MLDIKFVQENADLVKEKISSRGVDLDLSEFLKLAEEKKEYLVKIEKLRYELNKNSKLIGRMKREGTDASLLIKKMKHVTDEIKKNKDEFKDIDERIRDIMLGIPNIPHPSVPVGRDSSFNKELRKSGTKPVFDFDPKPHWEIGESLGILDFKRAAKLAGARFAVYKGLGARLERALINFMIDIHLRENEFEEVIPPFISNKESLLGTGNLPKFEEDLFKLKGYDWYLIPTAEVPLTNMFRDEIIEAESLPKRYVAYTPCFRSEAGSYGKDVRGLIRQHQFNKVELMSFSLPENSYKELEKITLNAEKVLKELNLHYRVVSLCTGDLGFAGAKTYDLEIWMPHRKDYVEISSCTNCEDFQARRANIRFRRNKKSRSEYVHTLNGSGVAVGRTVSSLLESYQREDGSVRIPEALHSYMGGVTEIA